MLALGSFKRAEECLDTNDESEPIGGDEVFGREKSCIEFGKNLIKRFVKKNDNFKDNDLSGISACSGAGKTTLLFYLFRYMKNGLFVDIKKGKYNTEIGGSNVNDLKRLKSAMGVFITYPNEKLAPSDEVRVRNGKQNLFYNPSLLWRIVYELMDFEGRFVDRKAFLRDIFDKSIYANSLNIGPSEIHGILKNFFPKNPLLLLIDETLNLDHPEDVYHTVAALLKSEKDTERNPLFVDAVVTALFEKGFRNYFSASGRKFNFIDCSLLRMGEIIGLFDELTTNEEEQQRRQMRAKVLDTMGLPQLVSILYEVCKDKTKNVARWLNTYEGEVYNYFKQKTHFKRYGWRFIAALLTTTEEEAAKENLVDTVIANNEEGITVGDFVKSGFIKLEKDGIYIAPAILDLICDRHDKACNEMLSIIAKGLACDANYAPKLFETIMVCQERLLGIAFQGTTMSIMDYYNLEKESPDICDKIKNNEIDIEPLTVNNSMNYFVRGKNKLTKEEFDRFNVPFTITHLKNPGHLSIDFVLTREKDSHNLKMRQGSKKFVYQVKDESKSRGTTVQMIFDHFTETVAECSKSDGRYGNYEYILVIVTLSGKNQSGELKTLYDDATKTHGIVLNNESLERYLLPIFRRRAFNADRFFDSDEKSNELETYLEMNNSNNNNNSSNSSNSDNNDNEISMIDNGQKNSNDRMEVDES